MIMLQVPSMSKEPQLAVHLRGNMNENSGCSSVWGNSRSDHVSRHKGIVCNILVPDSNSIECVSNYYIATATMR